MKEAGDARLDDLVTVYIDRLAGGERIDPEDILLAHPDVGPAVLAELRVYLDLDPGGDGDGGDGDGGDVNAPLGTLGDYTLRRQIGRGGMGVVYDAWQNSLGRQVALKVLPAGIAADARSSMRFLREAQIAAKLDHPRIVPVYASGVESGTPWYAMQYVEGETLSRVVKALRTIDEDVETVFGNKDRAGYFEKIARAFADVAEGLQHAHSKKVIHRDIKPSNLILDSEGGLRILDFGLARLEGQESLTISGDVVGTPLYMSPEQARRERIPVDHRTDIYSLGATMYELLTGRPPLKGKDHADTLSRIIEQDPVEPQKVNPRVPDALGTILMKCMRKTPEDRYGTAEALAQDLRRFVRGEPIEAKSQSGWDRWTRRLYRHRVALVAGGVIAALMIVGLIAATVLVTSAYSSAERERERLRRRNYVSDMRLALTDWLAGNQERAIALLGRHEPGPGETDLRGWDWRHLKLLTSPKELVATVTPGENRVDWTPDGRLLAAACSDGILRVYDMESNGAVRAIPASGISALDFHPSEARIAWASEDGMVTLVDLESGDRSVVLRALALPAGSYERRAIQWHPEGDQLAVYRGDDRVTIVKRDGRIAGLIEIGEALGALAWSPDGSRLLSLERDSGRLTVWSASGGETHPSIQAHKTLCYDAAWSPDGSRILTTAADWEVRVWDSSDRTLMGRLPHPGHVYCAEWSPDASLIATSGEDGIVLVWDAEKEEVVREFRGHSGRVCSVAWGSERTLASAGQDGRIHVWDVGRDQRGVRLEACGPVAWSKDGTRLAVTGRDQTTVRVLDSRTYDPLVEIDGQGTIRSIDLSAERLAVATNPGEGPTGLRIFEVSTGSVLGSFDDPETVYCIRWSPDGRTTASGSGQGTVRLRDPISGEVLGEWRDVAGVGTVAWSPRGRRLATLNGERLVRVLSLDGEEPAVELPLSASRRPIETLNSGRLAWSPDGRWIAQACINTAARGLAVWDTNGGSSRPVFRVSAHTTSTRSVAWSPDGSRIATGSTGGEIKIWRWDGDTAEELLAFRGHDSRVLWLAWDPSGEKLLSADPSYEVRVWEGPAGIEQDG